MFAQKYLKMKSIILSLFIVTLFTFSKCKKDVVTTDDNGLPAATQEGKNTLGFLINGQAWKPQGFDGSANLSVDVDFGYNNGIFSLAAYRITGNDRQAFGIGCDSLNSITFPTTLKIQKKSSAQIALSKNPCSIDYFDTTVLREGVLKINKLDKINHIIAGTFSVTLIKSGCDTFKITDGRFDMKF